LAAHNRVEKFGSVGSVLVLFTNCREGVFSATQEEGTVKRRAGLTTFVGGGKYRAARLDQDAYSTILKETTA